MSAENLADLLGEAARDHPERAATALPARLGDAAGRTRNRVCLLYTSDAADE